jgi:LAS superfamily LD-carboxypeptidase LdcB
MRNSGRPRLRAVLAGLVLGSGLLIGPLVGATPVLGVSPLPACEIRDVPASPRGYDDWATTLVDWSFTLGPDYKPPDLVSVRQGGVGGGGLVRQVVIEDLKALATAARDNGTPLVAWSPYRTYKQQAKLFNGGVSAYGYDAAITYWGRPGHSEHQLGVTIDFVAVGDTGLTSNWEVTRTGAWMARNAWKYGWLMSYPKGKQSVVCYHYEPWHYRYYGRDLAKKIHDSGLTPREYLWAHFTQVDPVTGLPLATASPSPSTSPIAPAATSPGSSPATGSSTRGGRATASPSTTNTVATPGLQPMAVFAIVLVALAAIGLVASFRFLRRRRRT